MTSEACSILLDGGIEHTIRRSVMDWLKSLFVLPRCKVRRLNYEPHTALSFWKAILSGEVDPMEAGWHRYSNALVWPARQWHRNRLESYTPGLGSQSIGLGCGTHVMTASWKVLLHLKVVRARDLAGVNCLSPSLQCDKGSDRRTSGHAFEQEVFTSHPYCILSWSAQSVKCGSP